MMPIYSRHLLHYLGLLVAWLMFLSGVCMAGSPSVARQNELINLIKHDCGSCHGMTLKGGLGPPLTTAEINGKPHGLLYNTIKFGRENTAMPPWQGLLTDDEISWLVTLLKQGALDNQGRK